MPEWFYWITTENQNNSDKCSNNFKAASGYKYYALGKLLKSSPALLYGLEKKMCDVNLFTIDIFCLSGELSPKITLC